MVNHEIGDAEFNSIPNSYMEAGRSFRATKLTIGCSKHNAATGELVLLEARDARHYKCTAPMPY